VYLINDTRRAREALQRLGGAVAMPVNADALRLAGIDNNIDIRAPRVSTLSHLIRSATAAASTCERHAV